LQFFTQPPLDFSLKTPEKTRKWLHQVILTEQLQSSEDISFIFCTDEHLHEINLDYLQHDTYTDIITFDNSEDESIIEGDLFISIDRIRENAQSFDASFEKELHRVMVHGILHLCGYGDKSTAEAEMMRSKENHYLEQSHLDLRFEI